MFYTHPSFLPGDPFQTAVRSPHFHWAETQELEFEPGEVAVVCTSGFGRGGRWAEKMLQTLSKHPLDLWLDKVVHVLSVIL